jgi:hypothetical protein
MNDKRKVSTDALETLGTIITAEEKRDAIHLAVIPVQATIPVRAGDDVNAEGKPERPYVGIVDPFLKAPVYAGEWFWLVIYPRQITSLRHVWSHPAFPEETASPFSKEESEEWIKNWLDSKDNPFNYDQFINLIDIGSISLGENTGARVEDEYIHVYGTDASGSIDEEVWPHVENILERKVTTRPQWFSCGC